MTGIGSPLLWASFLALVLLLLALDLGVLNRRDHEVSAGEALRWVGIFVGLALSFAAFLAFRSGGAAALDFLTGYLLELSLSVDNLFVFALILTGLAIPAALQHRVLFYGILGALVLRAGMIVGGAVLLARFAWLVPVFGAFLVLSGIRLLAELPGKFHPERGFFSRTLHRVIPSTGRFDGHRFVLVEGGRRVATPLLMALVLIELSDVVFALDSVPAIFGVTLDPFIVFSSNVFAVLGLRSLYFVLAKLMGRFRHLKTGLSVVLALIGLKMMLSRWVHLHSAVSLAGVLGVLGAAVAWSVLSPERKPGVGGSGEAGGGPPPS